VQKIQGVSRLFKTKSSDHGKNYRGEMQSSWHSEG
jgi:hypothetical protein